MTPQDYQRMLENHGYHGDEVAEMVDAYCREENLNALIKMGYTEEDLERSNPYNQWMYEGERDE